MAEADPLTLTPENLQHMARQRRHRLARALSRHYRVAENTVRAWFAQCRRLGADSEAALVEGARTLARRGHQHPLADHQEEALLEQCAEWPSALAELARIPLMEETVTT
ncbi:hypothetical protein EZI54_23620 [Marinobacter halodurans]|uniref:Helix-turn-helix domain-containing protein n=2 Tax=Marinobacter halodurans TaxID=2528979 RepID=A0ABY1ZH40_9GAMM|nr:hypothetical protein EZI54_23620 [Marinobacter halodurans]